MTRLLAGKEGSGGFSAARPAPPVAARTRPQTLLEICDIFGELAGDPITDKAFPAHSVGRGRGGRPGNAICLPRG